MLDKIEVIEKLRPLTKEECNKENEYHLIKYEDNIDTYYQYLGYKVIKNKGGYGRDLERWVYNNINFMESFSEYFRKIGHSYSESIKMIEDFRNSILSSGGIPDFFCISYTLIKGRKNRYGLEKEIINIDDMFFVEYKSKRDGIRKSQIEWMNKYKSVPVKIIFESE